MPVAEPLLLHVSERAAATWVRRREFLRRASRSEARNRVRDCVAVDSGSDRMSVVHAPPVKPARLHIRADFGRSYATRAGTFIATPLHLWLAPTLLCSGSPLVAVVLHDDQVASLRYLSVSLVPRTPFFAMSSAIRPFCTASCGPDSRRVERFDRSHLRRAIRMFTSEGGSRSMRTGR
jgi:hypothetical protein